MHPAALENKRLSTGVLPQLRSSADLPRLTPLQHTLTYSVLRSEDNGRVRLTATTTQELSVCVRLSALFLTALKKKRGLVSFH